MLVPQVLTGLIFPAQYMYVYTQLTPMPSASHDDSHPPPPSSAVDAVPSDLEPDLSRDAVATEYYPETVYEYPDGSQRVVPAGLYTTQERLDRTQTEVELHANAVRAAAQPSSAASDRNTYVLVSPPSPETLRAAANNPELLRIWPYAATPELCVHEPSEDAPDVCKHSGYAITLQRDAAAAYASSDDGEGPC